MRLGDHLSIALGMIGVTEERVTRWLGVPCGCKERRDKLNALGAWTQRVISGKTDRAEEHLNGLMSQTSEEDALRAALAADIERLKNATGQEERTRLAQWIAKYQRELAAIRRNHASHSASG